MKIAPQLVGRFQTAIETLTGGVPDRLGVAVSGGPDSLALLLLANNAMPGRVSAATVDHGLRPEAEEEAHSVTGICTTLGVPHAILKASVDRNRSSPQRAAREARYAALAKWLNRENIGWLATAHHADDQAETLLMRLLRGSGVAGLAGVRSVVPLPAGSGAVQLVRPLLGWRRSELEEVVRGADIQAVSDPSNEDPRFDRVRVRRWIAENPMLDAEPLARSAANLAEADEAIGWAAERLWQERTQEDDNEIRVDPGGLPAELKRRLVLKVLSRLGQGAAPRGEEVGRLLAALDQGTTATLSGVKCSGGSAWVFRPAPPRR
jgi:tRNA(Ile)-lysidine synthase